MAAAEVLAFAASDGWQPAQRFYRATRHERKIRREGDFQVGIQLQSQLGLISEAWVQLRSANVSLRHLVRSCLDIAHCLVLSCRGHGLGLSIK